MITDTIKITERGQITIPSSIRKLLKSNLIVFEVNEDKVMLKPVHNVAGSLKNYNKDLGNFNQVREKAWKKVIDDHKA